MRRRRIELGAAAALAASVAVVLGSMVALSEADERRGPSGAPAAASARDVARPTAVDARPATVVASPALEVSVEALEADLTAEVARLSAEVARLTSELAAARAATPGGDAPPGVEAASEAAVAGDATIAPQASARATVPRDAREAIEALLATIEPGAPMSADLWVALAAAQAAAGHHDVAARCLLEVLRADPDANPARERLTELDAAARVDVLLELAALHPDEDELLGDLADAEREVGRGGDAAAVYERALALDPADTEWAERLRDVDPARAVMVLEAALAGRPADAGVLANLARSYSRAGRSADALTTLGRALAAAPDDTNLTSLLVELDPPAAVRHLEAGVARSPNDDEVWGDLGDARRATGDLAGARAAYERAQTIQPGDSEWPEKLAALDPAGAITGHEARVREAPSDDEAWGDLGDAYRAVNRRGEALQAYQRARELDGSDDEWRDKIAAMERGE